jgi:hypothetical protein
VSGVGEADWVGRFAAVGAEVDEVVPAFTGLYPFAYGWSNWEMLLTRRQLLARTGDRVALWSRLSGDTPGRPVAVGPAADIRLLREGARFDRVFAAGRTAWTASEVWPVLRRWSEHG